MPDFLYDPIIAASLLMLVYSAGFALLAIVAALIDAKRPPRPRNSLHTIRRINRAERDIRSTARENAARKVC